MTPNLADFIDAERLTIVAEWETFARSLSPEADGMTARALRDHADDILSAIVHDMRSGQSAIEQTEKSRGRGAERNLSAIGKVHATLRIQNRFRLGQMVSEYRALRASVLRLWEDRGIDPHGVTRFNEAIDEALTVAVDEYSETTERFRDQSLGILGHDLRNPLAGIVMGATLLTKADELSDRSVRIAAQMLNSANRMNRMIADLLDLTRTRFGHRIPVTPVPTDLSPLCQQVAAELEGLRSRGITLERRGDLRGEWDADRIAQVLSNLLRNAIVYGAKDEAIVLRAEGREHDVVLQVHNGGVPIPREAQANLFQPMVRSGTDEHKGEGLGLGLYIASQIVQSHGGRLEVVSAETTGTTFEVRLPRAASAP